MTRLESVASWFQAHPGEWIDGRVLEMFGGRYAWRSRVSDCRTRLGLTIENRVRILRGDDGRVLTRISEYRYTGFVSKTDTGKPQPVVNLMDALRTSLERLGSQPAEVPVTRKGLIELGWFEGLPGENEP